MPLTEIIKLVNVGTLFAFILVNIGVVILRRTNPDMERPFRVPFSPVFPIIGVGLCVYLMTKLPGETWVPLRVLAARRLRHLLRLRPQALAPAHRGGTPAGDRAAAR